MKNRKENISQKEEINKAPEDLGDERMGNSNDNNESLASNLKYDEENEGYELDVEGTTKDYQHPNPYDTTAKDGEDMDSDWDEANLIVGDEYDKEGSLEDELDASGMHISEGKILELDPLDEALAQTPEDEREDLDEEGYPKNDGEVMP